MAVEVYEYKVIKVHFDLTELNNHLDQGWEIVNTTAQCVSGGGTQGVHGYIFYTLKKLKY